MPYFLKKFIKRVIGLPLELYRGVIVFIFLFKRRGEVKNFIVKPLSEVKPVLIQGMFRSGTSLTSSLVNELDIDFGFNENLIQAVGKSKELNPKGFYEHYLFAAISRYFHKITNSSGDNPPSEELIKKIKWTDINWKELVWYSVVVVDDKRVSFKNKLKMWDEFFTLGFTDFIKKEFKSPFAIKMPMLALFSELMLQVFPKGILLVVFRNPFSVVESAKKITRNSSFELYQKYHQHLSVLDTKIIENDVFYFSYDNLIEDPKTSVDQLYNFLNAHFQLGDNRQKAIDKIDMSLFRNRPKKNINDLPNNIKILYTSMLDKTIKV